VISAVQEFKAQVVVLPELFTVPAQADLHKYVEPCHFKHDKAITVNWLGRLCKDLQTYIIGGTIPDKARSTDSEVHNTSVCLDYRFPNC